MQERNLIVSDFGSEFRNKRLSSIAGSHQTLPVRETILNYLFAISYPPQLLINHWVKEQPVSPQTRLPARQGRKGIRYLSSACRESLPGESINSFPIPLLIKRPDIRRGPPMAEEDVI
jgi:hypothetical protein